MPRCRCAMQYHPDKNPGPKQAEAEERFKMVRAAACRNLRWCAAGTWASRAAREVRVLLRRLRRLRRGCEVCLAMQVPRGLALCRMGTRTAESLPVWRVTTKPRPLLLCSCPYGTHTLPLLGVYRQVMGVFHARCSHSPTFQVVSACAPVQVTEAFQVLGDPGRRAAHDRERDREAAAHYSSPFASPPQRKAQRRSGHGGG